MIHRWCSWLTRPWPQSKLLVMIFTCPRLDHRYSSWRPPEQTSFRALPWDSVYWHFSPDCHFLFTNLYLLFPGGTSGKEPSCQCRRPKRHGFSPWVRKMPWRRERQPTPVFLSGESHGRKPGGLQSIGTQAVGHDWSDWAYTSSLKQVSQERGQNPNCAYILSASTSSLA